MQTKLRNPEIMKKKDKKDYHGHIEFNDLVVDYIDGDIVIFDNMRDLTMLYPLKPMTNLIALCVKGSVVLTVNGRDSNITENDILFCPPNVKIENCIYSQDFECKILCLSDHIIQGLLRDRIGIWHKAVYINQTNIIRMSHTCREDFNFYYALLRSKINHKEKSSSREVVQTIIRALLLELCDVLEASEGVGEVPRILQSKQLFNRFLNLLSNSEVKRQPATYYAGQLSITPKYLTMLCQQYSDKTASEWIIQYTLDDIRYYLADLDYSIKEISVHLGFANMSHFGSYVRKHLGMSPSEYREKNIKKVSKRQ